MKLRWHICPPTTPLTEEQRAIVDKHKGLVYFVVFGLLHRHPEAEHYRDDLIGEGWLGLMRAAQIHDPTRTKFSTYACRAIGNRLVRMLRDMGLIHLPPHEWRDRKQFHPFVHCLRDLCVVDRPAAVPAPCEAVDLADYVRAMREAMRGLTAAERLVLRLRFGLAGEEALTLKEVGRLMHLTRERVRQIQDKALDQLRTIMQEDGR